MRLRNFLYKNKFLVTIIIFLIIILILNYFFNLIIINQPYRLNNILNKIANGNPDKACKTDSDCKMAIVSCGLCSSYTAVNINWNKKPYCPFRIPKIYCKVSASINDYILECIDNKCTARPK